MGTSTLTITATGADQTFTQTVTSPVFVTTTLTDFVSSCITTADTSSSDVASSTSSAPVNTPTAGLPASQDGQCGSASGQTCVGTTFGSCCSLYGYCGSTDIYCLTTEGCQSGYGECTTPSSVSSNSPPTPTSTEKVSIDGTCGGENAYVCPGSGLGDCCSRKFLPKFLSLLPPLTVLSIRVVRHKRLPLWRRLSECIWYLLGSYAYRDCASPNLDAPSFI